MRSLYCSLSATVLTQDWSTPTSPLEVGVYQGEPFSVVVFNSVINTLLDTLKTRSELGYHLHNTSYCINTLQYADDTCLVANCPAACQHLLQIVELWLEWSGMKAKIKKCHCIGLEGSSGHVVNPHLTLSGQNLPFIGNDSIKFLGLPIQIPHDASKAKS